ncbi:MAG: hypothetical protein Q9184_008118 [Pyrenodesmia sp. 2 TL-2023]
MTTPALLEKTPRTTAVNPVNSKNAQYLSETLPEPGDGDSKNSGAAVTSGDHSLASIYRFKGSYNILIPIRFKDRVRWLLKLPTNGCHQQDEDSAKALTSEALTTNFICHNPSVPAIRIYSFDSIPNNPVNCPNILMEKLGGKSLYYDWYHKSPAAQDRFREQALANIAKAMVQLCTFTFSSTGALQLDDDGRIKVGPCRKVDHFAAHDRLRLGQEATTRFSQQGPFSNPRDYFLTSLNREDPSILPHQQQGHRKLLRLCID